MNRLKFIIIGILLNLVLVWGDCPISLTNANVSPAPLTYLSDGNISFDMTESSERPIPLDDNNGGVSCILDINLSKIELKDHDIDLITGVVNTYFTISYEVANNRIVFTQKLDIPESSVFNISIPINVTGQSVESNSENGFSVSKTGIVTPLSEYTYTNIYTTPDYTPKIRLTGASTSGKNILVPAILTVTEINGGKNSDELIIRIPKHDYLSFYYDTEMTTLANKTVDNKNWMLINHPAEYRFKYIGFNSDFKINSYSKIGLEIIVNPNNGTSGKIDFKIDIKPGNGDENEVNDSDSSQIDYVN